ncbi:hypothetical protein RHGRI_034533 [Rhododendron griersonianum]|uniref:Uncharacterized protein n=2 Tax=Rhododendron griersonianum TaxID=479676 RepID=A0AAV6I1U4_9ERIC|nr:hypothetical protein RHGRI_034533 [Rhododendron griersonianum]
MQLSWIQQSCFFVSMGCRFFRKINVGGATRLQSTTEEHAKSQAIYEARRSNMRINERLG